MNNFKIQKLMVPSPGKNYTIEIEHITKEQNALETSTIHHPQFSGICMNLAGTIEISTANKSFKIRAGHYQLLHIPKDKATIVLSPGKHAVLLINIPVEFMAQFADEYPDSFLEYERASQHAAKKTAAIQPIIISTEMKITVDVLSNIKTESDDLRNYALYQMVVSVILAHLNNRETRETDTINVAISKKRVDPSAEFAHHLLTTEYGKVWTIDLLADRVGIHKRTLNTKFRRTFSISPMRYLHNIRLHKAKTLLTEQNASITKVAKHIGYKYTNDFTRAFSKYFGYAPTKLKQENQSNLRSN